MDTRDQALTEKLDYMMNLIQLLTDQRAYEGITHPDLWGNHSLHHPFLTWDNALIMMIITLLFTYNSRITTQYLEQKDDSM